MNIFFSISIYLKSNLTIGSSLLLVLMSSLTYLISKFYFKNYTIFFFLLLSLADPTIWSLCQKSQKKKKLYVKNFLEVVVHPTFSLIALQSQTTILNTLFLTTPQINFFPKSQSAPHSSTFSLLELISPLCNPVFLSLSSTQTHLNSILNSPEKSP